MKSSVIICIHNLRSGKSSSISILGHSMCYEEFKTGSHYLKPGRVVLAITPNQFSDDVCDCG